jgi:hypothetical protein
MSDHAALYAVVILALGLGIVATPLALLAFSFFDDTERALIEAIQLRTSASGGAFQPRWIRNSNPDNHNCRVLSAPFAEAAALGDVLLGRGDNRTSGNTRRLPGPQRFRQPLS